MHGQQNIKKKKNCITLYTCNTGIKVVSTGLF